MSRRVQIRRKANSTDPLKLVHDQGYEKGLAEGKVIAEMVAVKAASRARDDERQTHLKRADTQQTEIDRLQQRNAQLQNEIEQLQFQGRRADSTGEKIRKRLQTNDTKDWIAQFGDGDEPYVEDEGETIGDRAYRNRVRI